MWVRSWWCVEIVNVEVSSLVYGQKITIKIKRVPKLGNESAESYGQYTVPRATRSSIGYPEEVSDPVWTRTKIQIKINGECAQSMVQRAISGGR